MIDLFSLPFVLDGIGRISVLPDGSLLAMAAPVLGTFALARFRPSDGQWDRPVLVVDRALDLSPPVAGHSASQIVVPGFAPDPGLLVEGTSLRILSLPQRNRSEAAVVEVPGGALFCGGITLDPSTPTQATRAVDLFDFDAEQWVPAGDLPGTRTGATAARSAAGAIVVCGGKFGQDSLFTIDVRSPLEGRWTRSAPPWAAPAGISSPEWADPVPLTDGRILLRLMQQEPDGVLATPYLAPLDPVALSWGDVTELPEGATLGFANGVGLRDGRAVYLGGLDGIQRFLTWSADTGWRPALEFPERLPFTPRLAVLHDGRVAVAWGRTLALCTIPS